MNMRSITFLQPSRLTFGAGCLTEATAYLAALPSRRIHIVHSSSLTAVVERIRHDLLTADCTVTTHRAPAGEPTITVFNAALDHASAVAPSCIVGIGGGSALDLAKLLAAFVRNDQRVEDTFGIGLLSSRNCHLVCIPSTSGTGSEVSPNAILLDEAAQLKKGVISPHLVPDAAFIDPTLTPEPRTLLYDQHRALCSAALELMLVKNADYASSADPFRNFRMFGGLGVLVRASDKLARLRTFEERETFSVTDESLRDTILDLINYAVIYYAMKKEK